MKKILVIGANGRVGRLLVKKLAKEGYQVFAGARKVELESAASNVSFIHMDLLSDVDALATAMVGIDAVFFVSGSKGKDLLQIDLHGAVKTMQAAEKAGVKRYIMLSTIFALQPEKWNQPFFQDLIDYYIAKSYADMHLVHNSHLDYTILQPGTLLEVKGSGKISVNVSQPGENSIENVVETLVTILARDSTIGKIIMMHDGETPIEQALKQI